jgi:hypothetical protein
MDAKIETTEKGLKIEVTDLEGKKEQLLEAFQECSEGRCTCPTQEYEKVEKLEISDAEDKIQLSITAKDHEEIDVAEIEKCLAYTKKRVSGQQIALSPVPFVDGWAAARRPSQANLNPWGQISCLRQRPPVRRSFCCMLQAPPTLKALHSERFEHSTSGIRPTVTGRLAFASQPTS